MNLVTMSFSVSMFVRSPESNCEREICRSCFYSSSLSTRIYYSCNASVCYPSSFSFLSV
jgi:hypothetical protein